MTHDQKLFKIIKLEEGFYKEVSNGDMDEQTAHYFATHPKALRQRRDDDDNLKRLLQ